jgi:hypothetical protein
VVLVMYCLALAIAPSGVRMIMLIIELPLLHLGANNKIIE